MNRATAPAPSKLPIAPALPAKVDTTPVGVTFRIVEFPESALRYIVEKGSITIDGISLTVAAVKPSMLEVAIIPHTFEHTNLRSRRPGDRINIECDILAKHVEKLVAAQNYPHSR